MLRRIVVGVDGRAGGRDALALASVLQRAGGGEVIALHVYGYDRVVDLDAAAAAEATLYDELVGEVQDQLDAAGVYARPMVVSDPNPGRALHTVAAAEGADLIVVGSCHRAGLERVLEGDDTARTVHDAPCAVACAPPGFASRSHELRLIGVGYDGSTEAQRALRFATELAREADAYVRVTTAVAPAAPLPNGDPFLPGLTPAAPSERAAGEALLEHVVEEFGDRVTPELGVGAGWHVLASHSGDLDLLVVGSRDRGPLRRVLLGSTSTRLLREAACPVLVVPRTATMPPDEATGMRLGATDGR